MSRYLIQLLVAMGLAMTCLLSATSLYAQPAPAASSAPAAQPSPSRLPYTGGPVPEGYRLESNPTYGFIVIGGLLAGVGLYQYVAAGAGVDRNCDRQDESCNSENLDRIAGEIYGGTLMAAGVAATIVGLAVRNKYVVKIPEGKGDSPSDAPTRERQRDRERVMLHVAPQVGRHQIGLGMVGVF